MSRLSTLLSPFPKSTVSEWAAAILREAKGQASLEESSFTRLDGLVLPAISAKADPDGPSTHYPIHPKQRAWQAVQVGTITGPTQLKAGEIKTAIHTQAVDSFWLRHVTKGAIWEPILREDASREAPQAVTIQEDPLFFSLTTGQLKAEDSHAITTGISNTATIVISPFLVERGAFPATQLAVLVKRAVEWANQSRRPMRVVVQTTGHYLVDVAQLMVLRHVLHQQLDASQVHLHVLTSRFPETWTQPYNNLVRATLQALAAVVGGADAIEVLPQYMPEKSVAFAYRMARNTLLLLKHEAKLALVEHPLAGSHALNAIAHQLEAQTLDRLNQWAVDTCSGLIQKGKLQKWVAHEAEQQLQAVASGKRQLVGVTRYRRPGDAAPDFTQAQAGGLMHHPDSRFQVPKISGAPTSVQTLPLLRLESAYIG